MKILIVDHRQGNESTPELMLAAREADIILVIEPDNHVAITKQRDIPKGELGAKYLIAPHRDQISAERSREAWQRHEDERKEEVPALTPAEQFANVWNDSPDQGGKYPGNHGTAKIKGV